MRKKERKQEYPFMRKSVAVWLVDNTALTFEQIADFCGLHELEVQGIADGDVATGIVGTNPIIAGQLTEETIDKCVKNSKERLILKESVARDVKTSSNKKGKYIPVARRDDKPDGILFLIKSYPNITNLHIRKLVGTTNKMIDSIRDKSHWNVKNLRPRDPVLLGLCSQEQFNAIISKVLV